MECLQYSKEDVEAELDRLSSFKPCYKWNAFNTMKSINVCTGILTVLNLVINGMPSILKLYRKEIRYRMKF